MANKGSSLATGAYLATNDYLVSANGLYFAIMQGDGNLVIYGSDPAHQGVFVWNSGVAPGIGQYFVIMQGDGNLVVYKGSDPAHQGAFVWNSGKAPGAGIYVATMQNDGSLVVSVETWGSLGTPAQQMVRSTPTPAPAPTQPPQGPVILDLQPASMSFVGHLDCRISEGVYVCVARVFSRASNPGPLNWTAFVNFANDVTFSPGSGTLAPGASVLVIISIPTNNCDQGLFFFQGPANTRTITWEC